MTTDLRQQLGRTGEQIALDHLLRLGYRLVDRNFRTRHGELDLVVCDDDALVFVEVKARRAGALVASVDAVRPAKQRQVRSMASAWLAATPDRPRARELRFDVVGVTFDHAGRPVRLDHVEAAF